MRQLIKPFYLLIFSTMIMGCGSKEKIETASLTGEVKRMNGEPVADVTVVFYPASGPSVVAQTNEAGEFNATVAVGEAKVAVVANATASSEDTSPEALEAQAKADKESKVDPRFASPGSSGLTVTVEPAHEKKVVFVVD